MILVQNYHFKLFFLINYLYICKKIENIKRFDSSEGNVWKYHVTNQLLSENQTIVIEDLNVAGMLKNHCLARSIQELSLSRFKTMLMYKAEWYGREVIQVSRWFPSSKLCNCCGYKNVELTLKDREWVCPECGVIHDREKMQQLTLGMKVIKLK